MRAHQLIQNDDAEEMSAAGLDAGPRLASIGPVARRTTAAGVMPIRENGPPGPMAVADWRSLRAWVEWVTARFNVPNSLVPDCWWKHPALVEELSALHLAWRVAYDSQDAGRGPVMWLERWQAARPRLREAHVGSCAAGHKEVRARDWDGKTDEGEWEAWVAGASRQAEAP